MADTSNSSHLPSRHIVLLSAAAKRSTNGDAFSFFFSFFFPPKAHSSKLPIKCHIVIYVFFSDGTKVPRREHPPSAAVKLPAALLTSLQVDRRLLPCECGADAAGQSEETSGGATARLSRGSFLASRSNFRISSAWMKGGVPADH